MEEIRNREAVSDQSDDVLAYRRWLPRGPNIGKAEREVLRRLAGEVAELAARPVEAEKRQLWETHNALGRTRPLILCEPENGWNEIITPAAIECQSVLAQQWEFRLRKEVFWGARMGDDYTIRPYFPVPHVYAPIEWGLKETRIHDEAGWCYAWEAPIKSEADIEQLHFPTIDVDYAATERIKNAADDIFGDLLPARIKTIWWWSVVTTKQLAELRGAQHRVVESRHIRGDFLVLPGLRAGNPVQRAALRVEEPVPPIERRVIRDDAIREQLQASPLGHERQRRLFRSREPKPLLVASLSLVRQAGVGVGLVLGVQKDVAKPGV